MPVCLSLVIVFLCSSSGPPGDLKRWWADLGSADGAKAYQALGQLITASGESVPFLDEHLRPVEAVSRGKISQLVAGLGSERYAEREKAQQGLEKLQDLAEEELSKALAAGPTLEVRQRIERLLEKSDLLKSPERLRSLRAIEVLEHIGTPEARRVLQKLAKGAPEARQTREARASLERLAKGAKSASSP
jgi:hypothetical protein